MDAKLIRVQCSSLLGLRQLLLALPKEHVDDQLQGHIRGLMNSPAFWTLTKSSEFQVKIVMYTHLHNHTYASVNFDGPHTYIQHTHTYLHEDEYMWAKEKKRR